MIGAKAAQLKCRTMNVRILVHKLYKMWTALQSLISLATSRLEFLNFGSNSLAALSKRESLDLVLETFSFPILCLLCWFEGWVLPDCSMCIRIDLFNILRPNPISQVRCKLLLESGGH
jgi:hypothetical protein